MRLLLVCVVLALALPFEGPGRAQSEPPPPVALALRLPEHASDTGLILHAERVDGAVALVPRSVRIEVFGRDAWQLSGRFEPSPSTGAQTIAVRVDGSARSTELGAYGGSIALGGMTSGWQTVWVHLESIGAPPPAGTRVGALVFTLSSP